MFGYDRGKSSSDSDESSREDCEALISSNEKSEDHSFSQRPSTSGSTSGILRTVLLILAFPLTALTGAYFGGSVFEHNSNCISKISKYSPLLEDVDITFSTKAFNGSLFKANVFRQPAGPEVDAAWESLGVDYRAAIVPTQLAGRAGILQSQVQVREKYGGGYPANVEGLHHLHCLNLLRQSLYYNFEYYHSRKQGAFKNDDHVLQAHVTHCLDILRQQLQCTVDISVLGQVWWDQDAPKAYPDFNTKHVCRNFEAVRAWAEKHQAPKDVPPDYLKIPRREDVYETMP